MLVRQRSEVQELHSGFDKRIHDLRMEGHEVPTREMIKTPEDIEALREAGKMNTMVLDYAEQFVREGISTEELNVIIDEYTRKLEEFRRRSIMKAIRRVSVSRSTMWSATEFLTNIRSSPQEISSISTVPLSITGITVTLPECTASVRSAKRGKNWCR